MPDNVLHVPLTPKFAEHITKALTTFADTADTMGQPDMAKYVFEMRDIFKMAVERAKEVAGVEAEDKG